MTFRFVDRATIGALDLAKTSLERVLSMLYSTVKIPNFGRNRNSLLAIYSESVLFTVGVIPCAGVSRRISYYDDTRP